MIKFMCHCICPSYIPVLAHMSPIRQGLPATRGLNWYNKWLAANLVLTRCLTESNGQGIGCVSQRA